MNTRYRRVHTVEEEEFEDDLVVMHAVSHAVVTLNASARVIWEALAEPVSLDDLAALFAEAFPDAVAVALRGDIGDILARLEDAELLTAADG